MTNLDLLTAQFYQHQRQDGTRGGRADSGLDYNRRKDKECSNFHKRRLESNRFVMMLITSLYQPCNEQPHDEETKAGLGSSAPKTLLITFIIC